MTPERWRQIEQIYHSTLERDAGQRISFLKQACAGDEVLREKANHCSPINDKPRAPLRRPPRGGG